MLKYKELTDEEFHVLLGLDCELASPDGKECVVQLPTSRDYLEGSPDFPVGSIGERGLTAEQYKRALPYLGTAEGKKAGMLLVEWSDGEREWLLVSKLRKWPSAIQAVKKCILEDAMSAFNATMKEKIRGK